MSYRTLPYTGHILAAVTKPKTSQKSESTYSTSIPTQTTPLKHLRVAAVQQSGVPAKSEINDARFGDAAGLPINQNSTKDCQCPRGLENSQVSDKPRTMDENLYLDPEECRLRDERTYP